MTQRLLSILCLLVFALVAAGQSPPPKTAVAQVYLLDNFRILEGVGEQVGEVYRLQIGTATQEIPIKRVLFIGESRDMVQKYLLAQATKSKPPTDPSERLTAEATKLFAGTIQPILMNACAHCHTDPKTAGRFSLERIQLGYADTTPTRTNLVATAAFTRASSTAEAPLLSKAVTPHGGATEPPLSSRSHPAFRNLERFVQLVGPAQVEAPANPAVRPVTPMPTMPTTNSDDPFDPAIFHRLSRSSR